MEIAFEMDNHQIIIRLYASMHHTYIIIMLRIGVLK